MRNKNKRQFTLIELIIVIVVIGILAGMALPKFIGVQRNANVAAMETDLDVIEKAVLQYVTATDDGSYPFLDTNNDKVINDEDLYFKTGNTPQTLKDSLLNASSDDGSKIYKLDMGKLEPYISKIKYPDTEYLYSEKSDTAIDPIGKADGDNFIHHIIGSGPISENTDTQKAISLTRDKTISVGRSGTLYIGSDGEVYGTGNINNDSDIITEGYLKLTTNANATKVISTYNNWAYINNKGEVYTRGRNSDNQLGRPFTDGNYDFSTTFELAPLPSGIKAVDIDLAQYNLVVLGDDGNLYACGYNDYSKSYDEGVLRLPELTKIDVPTKNKIKSFITTDSALVVLDDKGIVYVIGVSGVSYELGLDSREWGIYNFDYKVVDIAVSERSMIVIDEKGNLYSAGGNYYGQLGLGDTVSRKEFTQIPLEEGIVPKTIEGNLNQFFMLTTNGDLYGWGYNDYDMFKTVKWKSETKPVKINYSGINKVNKIYSMNICSSNGFIFEDSNGQLKAIGMNYFWHLGVAPGESIFTEPLDLNLTMPIKK